MGFVLRVRLLGAGCSADSLTATGSPKTKGILSTWQNIVQNLYQLYRWLRALS